MKINLRNSPLDLELIFESGQIFRWRRDNTGNPPAYVGFIKGVPVRLSVQDAQLNVQFLAERTLTADEIAEFFDLSTDYEYLLKGSPDYAKKLYKRYRGLRILHQEPLECAASFITSSNNNIKRINLLLDRLSEKYGEEVASGFYRFPELSVLYGLGEGSYRELGFGYRSTYLHSFFTALRDKYEQFIHIFDAEYAEAKKWLLQFKGIGEKVADCILLYGFHKLEAFPVDVWIKRAMKKYNIPDAAIAQKRFAKAAGLVQLLLFMDIRGL